MADDPKFRAAIYCRLSEEDKHKSSRQDDSLSIQNQKRMLQQYAGEQGWEIYDIYSDDDYAGADRNRPQFRRLLKDAEERKFDIVLCKTQSRFTRELELVEKYIHGLFPAWGIRFVSIVDHADTDSKGNKKSRQINGLVNEWYLEDMSENIRSVLTDRRRNGYHIGAFALYGYKKDPDRKGHLLVDEEAAAVVREVFELFSRGYGKTAIARILNERGIPNPTEYKRLHGLRYRQPKSKSGALWKYPAISDMLGNEMYIGNMVQGKYGSVSYKTKQNRPRPRTLWYVVEGTHEPVIARELWDQVQAMRRQRTKPFSTGKTGLFAGKVRCRNCGYVMRSSKTADGRYYLKCPTRHVARDACEGAFVSAKNLEEAVLGELNRLLAEYLDEDAVKRNIETVYARQGQKKSLEMELAVYQKKTEEYRKAVRELYLDKIKGVLTQEEYLELSEDFSAQKKRLEKLTEEAKQNLGRIGRDVEDDDTGGQLPESCFRPDHLSRPMVEQLIDCIFVEKKDPVTREVPVEIHWKF